MYGKEEVIGFISSFFVYVEIVVLKNISYLYIIEKISAVNSSSFNFQENK